MTNTKRSDFLHSVMVRIFLLIMFTTLVAALPRIATATQTATLAQCPAGTHQAAGQCIPDVAPVAEDTDTTAEDVAAEGTDVLPVSFNQTPTLL